MRKEAKILSINLRLNTVETIIYKLNFLRCHSLDLIQKSCFAFQLLRQYDKGYLQLLSFQEGHFKEYINMEQKFAKKAMNCGGKNFPVFSRI